MMPTPCVMSSEKLLTSMSSATATKSIGDSSWRSWDGAERVTTFTRVASIFCEVNAPSSNFGSDVSPA